MKITFSYVEAGIHPKLGKVFHLGFTDDGGCNWSITIARNAGWQDAADHIRPFIIELRSKYNLADE